MKITKSQLKQIVKEEINRLLSEGGTGAEAYEGGRTSMNLDDDWRHLDPRFEREPGLGYGEGVVTSGAPAFSGDSDRDLTTAELEAKKWINAIWPEGYPLPGGQRVPSSSGTQIQSKESGGKRFVVAREDPGWTENEAADLRRRLGLELPEDAAARKDREASRVVKGSDPATKRAIQNALHAITGGRVPKWQSHMPLKGSTLPEFYEDLEKYNLSHVLGTEGEDYSWGRAHEEALAQLKAAKEKEMYTKGGKGVIIPQQVQPVYHRRGYRGEAGEPE